MSNAAATPNPWAAKWAARYALRAHAAGTAPNAYLRSHAHRLVPNMRALCPGEGEGRNAVWLAEAGCLVTAVDFAAQALARAEKLAADRRVQITTIEADLSTWHWPAASFDLVALIFVQVTADERAKIHAGAVRALAPGGVLLLEAFAQGANAEGGRLACGPPTDDARYSEAILRQDFAALDIQELLVGMTTLREGTAHDGPARVVRLAACKPA
jgi:SAM-dependent methyltransferase